MVNDHAQDVLGNLEDVGLGDMHALFGKGGDGFSDAFNALDTSIALDRTRDDVAAACGVFHTFVHEHGDDLEALTRNLTIASGRLYLMGAALHQVHTAFMLPKWWAGLFGNYLLIADSTCCLAAGWVRGIWLLQSQKGHQSQASGIPFLRFVGRIDDNCATQVKQELEQTVMEQWWNGQPEAGP